LATTQLASALAPVQLSSTLYQSQGLYADVSGSAAVEKLILWRDVKKSGMLFGACTALSLFFFITKMSLATFICYVIALALIVCTAWSKLGANIGKCAPPPVSSNLQSNQ
jgi:hypothetical protein